MNQPPPPRPLRTALRPAGSRHTGLVLLAAVGLIGGCAADFVLYPSESSDDTTTPITNSFYLRVQPTPGLTGDDELLDQTFGTFEQGDGFELTLQPARRLAGKVQAVRVTPWLANLPTEVVPVPGQVILRSPSSGETRTARTSDDGEYELLAVPGEWLISVVPDDARVSAHTQVLLLDDRNTRQDFTLDPGESLWGRVTDAEGFPIAGASVRAWRDEGDRSLLRVSSGTTTTDAEGWYELRVDAGRWAVQTAGRPNGRDPSLEVSSQESNTRVDLRYPTNTRASLTARIVDPNGLGLQGVRVRMTSDALYGYEDVSASYQVDVTSDSRGYIDTRVPAGDWVAEVLPGKDDPWSALVIPDLRVNGDVDLGTQRLTALEDQGVILLDPLGQPIVAASVRLTERTTEGRSWTTTTDENGLFIVPSLGGPADLEVIPTSGVGTLSAVRLTVQPGTLPQTLQLPEGEHIGGRVTWQSPTGVLPLPFAEVKVIDEAGVVRGYGVSDDAGMFAVYVAWDWQPADDTGM